jgi:hypothetical protein
VGGKAEADGKARAEKDWWSQTNVRSDKEAAVFACQAPLGSTEKDGESLVDRTNE